MKTKERGYTENHSTSKGNFRWPVELGGKIQATVDLLYVLLNQFTFRVSVLFDCGDEFDENVYVQLNTPISFSISKVSQGYDNKMPAFLQRYLF